jgi:hypothetical protein
VKIRKKFEKVLVTKMAVFGLCIKMPSEREILKTAARTRSLAQILKFLRTLTELVSSASSGSSAQQIYNSDSDKIYWFARPTSEPRENILGLSDQNQNRSCPNVSKVLASDFGLAPKHFFGHFGSRKNPFTRLRSSANIFRA